MKIEEIQKLESLNNEFRDILVGLREFLFSSDETMYSDEARGFQKTMDNCVREGKKILRENNIKTEEELKSVCKKFLIPDFLNGLFDNNVYIPEEEIDCGL
ncbi:hypothetical protein [uncultured Clostridium sp.]|uniref:hypothetical protein n=1 Tax=uncultured Clostridium sp. TaxID=59620 RepID=UPI0026169810|nr:hypothetical protein [uncultured Clostridium sp.]